jgi:hypothetical protein
MVYLAPSVGLRAGVGIDRIARWLRDDHRRTAELVFAIVLVGIPIGGMIDNALTRRAEAARVDLPGFFEAINDAFGRGDRLVIHNPLDPHSGPGPKIQWELYRMTHLQPVPVPADALEPPPGRLFVLIYTKGPIRPASDARRYLDKLETEMERIDRRRTYLARGDADEQINLFVYRVRSPEAQP